MNETVTEFLTPIGPTASATASASNIFNISVGATNTDTDLTAAGYAGLKTAIDAAHFITLTASVDIWYRWDTAAGTVSEASTAVSTPANQGVLLPAGASVTRLAPSGATHLIAKGVPSAGTLCVEISSKSIAKRLSFF